MKCQKGIGTEKNLQESIYLAISRKYKAELIKPVVVDGCPGGADVCASA